MVSKKKLDSMSEGCSVNRPRLEFYHPNAKGTGCAMVMKLRPADFTREGGAKYDEINSMIAAIKF